MACAGYDWTVSLEHVSDAPLDADELELDVDEATEAVAAV